MDNLSEKDRLFLMVGRCLTAWNQIEERILHLIEYALAGEDDEIEEIAYGYWAVVSFEARLKWCSAIVNARTKKPGFEDVNALWNSLNNHLIKKAAKRAEVAHGSVVELHGSQPEFYPYFHKKITLFNREPYEGHQTFRSAYKPLTVQDLENRERGFYDTERRIVTFGIEWRRRESAMRGK